MDFEFSVASVTYHAPSDVNKWIKIKEDPQATNNPNNVYNDGDPISGESATVAFASGGNGGSERKPVAYVSGAMGRVSAQVETNCPDSIYLRAAGPDNFNLPWRLAERTSDSLYYPATDFSTLFQQNKVLYYDEFTLEWYATRDTTSGMERDIGTSRNHLYVLFDVPTDQSILTYYELSLVDIACRSAHEVMNNVALADSIYGDFTDRCVRKFNGSDCMSYWGEQIPPQGGLDTEACFTYQALIAYANATCGAWSDLFKNCLDLHGVDLVQKIAVTVKSLSILPAWAQSRLGRDGGVIIQSNTSIYPPNVTIVNEYRQTITSLINTVDSTVLSLSNFMPDVIPAFDSISGDALVLTKLLFMVNKWESGDIPAHRLIRSEVGNAMLDITSDISYPQYFVPPTDLDLINGGVIPNAAALGSPGQGNPNPRSEFFSHAINRFAGRYYDPSYGSGLLSSQSAWEQASLAHYAIRVIVTLPASVTADGMPVDRKRMLWVYADEGTTNQTVFWTTP